MTLIRETTKGATARRGLQDFFEYTVDSKAYDQSVLVRLNMDIRSVILDCLRQQGVNQADDWRIVIAVEQVRWLG